MNRSFDPVPRRPFIDPHARDDAAVLVELAVEDQRLERRVGVAGRRRDALDHRVEQLGHAVAGLGRDPQDVVGRDAEDVLDLHRVAVGIGGRQVDLVERGHDLEVVLHRQVAVGQRLRLDALGGVDHQHHALARGERPADLVAEVDVARRVDQVEHVALPLDTHVLRLDRDAPLALEVHRVEVLLAHVTGIDGAGDLEDAVGERRLAVIDVGDDREVADAGEVHGGVDRSYERWPHGRARSVGRPWCSPIALGRCSTTPRGTHPWPTSRARRSAILTNAKRAERNKAVQERAEDARQEGRRRTHRHRRTATSVRLAVKRLDMAAAKGVIHPNQAARRKSRLHAEGQRRCRRRRPADAAQRDRRLEPSHQHLHHDRFVEHPPAAQVEVGRRQQVDGPLHRRAPERAVLTPSPCAPGTRA